MTLLRFFNKACLLLALWQAMIISSAHAANIIVNSTADDGGGTNNATVCTLREAVVAANEDSNVNAPGCVAGEGADTIMFSNNILVGGGATITLTQPTVLNITSDIDVTGLGKDVLTISGTGISSVFEIRNAAVAIKHVMISGGSALNGGGIFATNSNLILDHSIVSGNVASGSGGGVNALQTDVRITNSTIADNRAVWGGGMFVIAGSAELNNSTVLKNRASYGFGGGMYVERSDVTITHSTVSKNSAGGHGGGIISYTNLTIIDSTISDNTTAQLGGGIYASGRLSLSNSHITGNRAGYGGGVRAGGVGSIVETTVTGNEAAFGGGLYLGSGIVVRDSTIFGNTGTQGGGLYINAFGGSVSVTQCTVSGNSASYTGGGIFIQSGENIAVVNSTISGNMARYHGGGVAIANDWGGRGNGSKLHLSNSIVSGNTGTGLGLEIYLDRLNDPRAEIIADSRNVFGDDSKTNGEAFFDFTPGSDDVNATLDGFPPRPLESILGPLQDNGGSTLTHDLVFGSMAINNGDNPECPKFDQRGEPRDDGICDIGAVEFSQNVPTEDAACYSLKAANRNVITFCW